MFVCICHGITDKAIYQSIEQGANSLRCLTECLHVGRDCGRCMQKTKHLLASKMIEIAFIDQPQQIVA